MTSGQASRYMLVRNLVSRRGFLNGASSAKGPVPLRSPARDIQLVAARQAAEPVPGGFGGALQCGAVDPHQAERRRVAEGPFEIVHQRPGEIALQIGLLRQCAAAGGEVVAQEGDAAQVLDPSVRAR